MGLGTKLLKILFIIANVVLFLCGAGLMALALYANLGNDAQSKYDNFTMALSERTPTGGALSVNRTHIDFAQHRAAIWSFVAIGGVIALIGFLGCCGAALQSRLMLYAYATAVAVIIIVQVVVAAWMFMMIGTEGSVRQSTAKFLSDLKPKNLVGLQREFKCCGVHDGEVIENTQAPCKAEHKKVSCFDRVWSYMETFGLITGITGMVIILFELLAIILACLLISNFKNDN